MGQRSQNGKECVLDSEAKGIWHILGAGGKEAEGSCCGRVKKGREEQIEKILWEMERLGLFYGGECVETYTSSAITRSWKFRRK